MKNAMSDHNIKAGWIVRIICNKAAQRLGLSLWTLGRVIWVARRSPTIEVDVGDKKVMLKSHQVERVKLRPGRSSC